MAWPGICRGVRSDGVGMSDETAERAAALAALRRRYRVRFLVYLEHAGRSYGHVGSTMAETSGEVEAAAVDVLRRMLARAVAQLEAWARADGDEVGQ